MRNRWFLDPVLLGAYPEDGLSRFGEMLPPSRRRPAQDLGADRLPGRELLPPARRRGGCRRIAGRRRHAGERADRDGVGGLPGRAARAPRAPTRRVRPAAALRHRERRRVRRRPHERAGRRRAAHGLHRTPHRRDRRRDRRRRPRRAATSSGRSSTTSSGRVGFSQRFGIVYVDFETLERVPKDSFLWYRDFIAAQRAPQA